MRIPMDDSTGELQYENTDELQRPQATKWPRAAAPPNQGWPKRRASITRMTCGEARSRMLNSKIDMRFRS